LWRKLRIPRISFKNIEMDPETNRNHGLETVFITLLLKQESKQLGPNHIDEFKYVNDAYVFWLYQSVSWSGAGEYQAGYFPFVLSIFVKGESGILAFSSSSSSSADFGNPSGT